MLLLDTFTNHPLPRPPIWMMRQAGRYMHEYQAVRQKHSFLDICKIPEVAIEVTCQPLDAFGFDASIIFSDILIPLEAMGLDLSVTDGLGPRFSNPVRNLAEIDALQAFDPSEKTPFLAAALQGMRKETDNRGITLIGFAGAPWTLASYAVEGMSWKTGATIKAWLYEDPAAIHHLLQRITDQLIPYLRYQADAGAQVLQLFDSWGGLLPTPYYREFIHNYQAQVIAALKQSHPQVPIILFVKGSRELLPTMAQAGADALSIDELTPLRSARQQVGNAVTLQGNLDSAALFIQQPERLDALVDDVLQQGMANNGQRFIFNLGHGVLPKTPRENVRRVVERVQAFRYQPAVTA
jgi:uroporphyrinogen decarboxylase